VQIHLAKCEGNPLCLDRLILDRITGRFLAIEHKTATGRASRRQEWLMQAHGHAVVCRSPAEVVAAVRGWMEDQP